MTEVLYPHQAEAIARIARGDQVYLGHDPGLGKSRTALEAARSRDAKRILVIAPASGRYIWEREVKKWTRYAVHMVRTIKDLSGPGVFVLTYGLISKAGSPFAAAVAGGIPFDMTILDEAAALKNAGANRTKAILGTMLTKLGYVVPLSGTPAPNHAGELYPILKALYPQALLSQSGGRPMHQWEFEDQFCKVVRKRFGAGREVRVIEGSRNLAMLRQRIEGFMLRVRKEEVLKDLPPVRYDVVPLGVEIPSPAPTLPDDLGDDDLMAYLAGRMDDHLMKIRHALGACKTLPAVEYIDDFMENLPHGRKVLVFAHHKDVIHQLFVGLADWNPVVVTGASTAAERTTAIDTFLSSSRCRIFLANIQAAGTGLTLVGPKCDCSDVIFVEASYSVGDNVQAAARVHRIGQKDAVVARFLTAHGTIDDRIQDVLARKARDFAALFD